MRTYAGQHLDEHVNTYSYRENGRNYGGAARE